MDSKEHAGTLVRTLSTVLGGLALVFSTACGIADDPTQHEASEPTGQVTGAITDGWTNLVPINGWSSYWSSPTPAIGKINGVVTLRGAVKATNPTSDMAFDIPANLWPDGVVAIPVVMNNWSMGSIQITPGPNGYVAHIQQNNSPGIPGDNAKAFTSLDGVGWDLVKGSNVPTAWYDMYPYRVVDGAFAKTVNATAGGGNPFSRMQGFLCKVDQCFASSDFSGYLFTLPSGLTPGQTTHVPTHLGLGGGSNNGSWGLLSIYSTGEVYVNGNPPMANRGTSLEASFSKTLVGNAGLSFRNNWVSYSARAARVGKYGGVVRFQGAIKNGTNKIFAVLPSSMWPPKDVFLVAAANGPVPAVIVVSSTNGEVRVEGPPPSVAAVMTSLDGVSFAL